jgi:hypothetical protein
MSSFVMCQLSIIQAGIMLNLPVEEAQPQVPVLQGILQIVQ